MLKIQLGNKDYELKGVTLDTYEKLQEDNKMENVDFISLITGIPVNQIKRATLQQINFVAKVLNNYVSNETQRGELRPLIFTGKEILGLINPSKMTYGEWVDLESLLSMRPLNFKHIASILYRPTTKYDKMTNERILVEYDYDECLERSKNTGDMLLKDILSGIFFLTKFNQISVEDTLTSMEKKLKKEM